VEEEEFRIKSEGKEKKLSKEGGAPKPPGRLQKERSSEDKVPDRAGGKKGNRRKGHVI